MSLVEALVHDGVDEGRAVEEQPLVLLLVVLLAHLLAPVHVALPQPLVAHLLNLLSTITHSTCTRTRTHNCDVIK